MRFHLLAAAPALSLVLSAPAVGADAHAHEGHLGKVDFANSCDAKVQPRAAARRGDAAFVLVFRRARRRSAMCSRTTRSCAIATWGIAAHPDEQPARRAGRLAQGAPSGAGRDRAGPPHRREDPARARLHRGGGRLLRRLRRRGPSGPASSRARRPSRRWPRSIPTTTRRRSSPRCTWPARSRRPIRPMPPTSRRPAVLEKLFVKYPDHPGVAHYLIHSYDAPPIAKQGADRGAPVLRHRARLRRMRCTCPRTSSPASAPGRTRCAINRRSADVAKKDSSRDEAYHAADYMVYAHLQLGRDQAARQVIEEFDARSTAPSCAQFAGALRRGGDAGAPGARARRLGRRRRSCSRRARTFPFVEAITTFARALGAARRGDAAAAEQEAAAARGAAQGAARRPRTATGRPRSRCSASPPPAWIARPRARPTRRCA